MGSPRVEQAGEGSLVVNHFLLPPWVSFPLNQSVWYTGKKVALQNLESWWKPSSVLKWKPGSIRTLPSLLFGASSAASPRCQSPVRAAKREKKQTPQKHGVGSETVPSSGGTGVCFLRRGRAGASSLRVGWTWPGPFLGLWFPGSLALVPAVPPKPLGLKRRNYRGTCLWGLLRAFFCGACVGLCPRKMGGSSRSWAGRQALSKLHPV